MEQPEEQLLIWNLSLARRIFKNGKGEFYLVLNDALNRGRNQETTFASSYIESSEYNIRGKYIICGFTYNFRKFGI